MAEHRDYAHPPKDPPFCCEMALPFENDGPPKLYLDENRELHEAIRRSYLNFGVKKGKEFAVALAALEALTLSEHSSSSAPSPTALGEHSEVGNIWTPEVLEQLANNPLQEHSTPYVVHLQTRHDFGSMISHRYFVCPEDLEEDWVEISQIQWLAAGYHFGMNALNWDLKCTKHVRFFRSQLRPNLKMRGPWPVASGAAPVADIGTPGSIAPDSTQQVDSSDSSDSTAPVLDDDYLGSDASTVKAESVAPEPEVESSDLVAPTLDVDSTGMIVLAEDGEDDGEEGGVASAVLG